jgi:hypothetical protein
VPSDAVKQYAPHPWQAWPPRTGIRSRNWIISSTREGRRLAAAQKVETPVYEINPDHAGLNTAAAATAVARRHLARRAAARAIFHAAEETKPFDPADPSF